MALRNLKYQRLSYTIDRRFLSNQDRGLCKSGINLAGVGGEPKIAALHKRYINQAVSHAYCEQFALLLAVILLHITHRMGFIQPCWQNG